MTEQKKTTQAKPKAVFLQPYSSVKPYDPSNFSEAFADMKSEMNSAPDPKGFRAAAGMIGTHAPKLASARNKSSAMLLNSSSGGNRPGRLAASGDAKWGQYMKVLLRPIALLGEEGEPCLFERLRSADAQRASKAFEAIFGTECLDAVLDALNGLSAAPRARAWTENYPVFFIPGENGGDLQAAPGGSIDAHANMSELRVRMLADAKQDRLAEREATYGEWSVMGFSDKPWNLVVGAPMERTRFRAEFPKVLSNQEAEIWAFRQSGAFPRLRDPDAAATLVEFAYALQKFEDKDAYRGGDVYERLVENRAKFLVLRARNFVQGMISDLAEAGLIDRETFSTPDLKGILSRLDIHSALSARKNSSNGRDEKLKVLASLNSPTFQSALKKWGETQ